MLSVLHLEPQFKPLLSKPQSTEKVMYICDISHIAPQSKGLCFSSSVRVCGGHKDRVKLDQRLKAVRKMLPTRFLPFLLVLSQIISLLYAEEGDLGCHSLNMSRIHQSSRFSFSPPRE